MANEAKNEPEKLFFWAQVKTYKSVEEVKGKLGQDSLRRNGSGKKVSYSWQHWEPEVECVLSKVDGVRGASVTSPGDDCSSKNGGKLRRGSSGRSAGCNDLILRSRFGFFEPTQGEMFSNKWNYFRQHQGAATSHWPNSGFIRSICENQDWRIKLQDRPFKRKNSQPKMRTQSSVISPEQVWRKTFFLH